MDSQVLTQGGHSEVKGRGAISESFDSRLQPTPEKANDGKATRTLSSPGVTPLTAAESQTGMSPVTPKNRRYQVTTEIEEEAQWDMDA